MSLPPVGPMPSVFVRPATEHDAGFLVDVVLVATRAQGRLSAGFDEQGWRAEEEQWTRRLLWGDEPGQEHSDLSVVEIDGAPAGRLRVIRESEVLVLAGIQLLPAHQGHGVGTHLIEQLVVEARDSGRPLRLRVEHDNPRARTLYERLGFVVVAEHERDVEMEWRAAS